MVTVMLLQLGVMEKKRARPRYARPRASATAMQSRGMRVK